MIRLVGGRCPLCPEGTPTDETARGRDFEYGTTPDEFSVVTCQGCGTSFLDPRPADDDIALLYPPEYEPYHFDTLPAPVRWARDRVQAGKVKAILRHAGADARILDVGCGGGALLRLLKSQGPSTLRLRGWDYPGPHMMRLAETGIEVISAPIVPGTVAPASADVIVLNQVIEHFARPDDVLAMAREALAPGGVIIIETPDTGGVDAALFGSRYWGGYHFPRHLVLFNAASLRRLVENVGFEVVEVKHQASPAFWNQSVHHLLSERKQLRRVAPFFSVRNPVTMGVATAADLVLRLVRATSNVRIVARRPTAGRAIGIAERQSPVSIG